MINNMTYRSVDEAAKLGGDTLRVFGRLIAHRIDAVMNGARVPGSGPDAALDGAGAAVRRPAVGSSGFDAWFVRR